MPPRPGAALGWLSLWLVCACSGVGSDGLTVVGKQADASARDGATDFKHTDNPSSIVVPDAGSPKDAGPKLDAFFINDPAPPVCGANGVQTEAKPIDGTPECPGDKNREGCGCDKLGEMAPCWPGKRVNRNKGSCKDGVTTCSSNLEFGLQWGPCKGYVLPTEGASEGSDACRCFSNGKWALNNLVPCVYRTDQAVYLYSSHPDPSSGYTCDPVSMSPPPKPPQDWNTSTLSGDCAGQFKLCYTMKAGAAATPKSDDCVVMTSCVDVWYGQAGKDQPLPNLPGWTSSDASCSKKFIELGGYGEMSVLGKSMECDAVDDGHGQPYVFKRTSYCPPTCSATPTRPECMACSIGGSGQF